MKLHLANPEGNHLITGYGQGWVQIGQARFEHNLIVLPGQLVPDWAATTFEALDAEHFAAIAALKPEIVLLGTGATHRFAHPRLWKALADIGLGLECMDTGAACRTYNILMAEGRNVAAALIL
jgi:uncharacterized protein